MRIKIWLCIAMVFLVIMAVISIFHVFKKGEKSNAEKIVSIICAVLGVVIAIAGFQYTGQNIVSVEKGFIENSNIVIGDGNTVSITNNFHGMDTEESILLSAELNIKAGNFDVAKSSYELLMEQGHKSGTLGMGYLYAHGYGVEQDVEKAIELYDSIIPEETQARKNKLALYIATCRDKEYILSEMEYFINSKDDGVLDYLSSCEKILGKSNLISNYKLDDLRCYSLIGTNDYENPPRDTGYSVFKFIGAHFGEEGSRSLPFYSYEEYVLLFIDKIETMTLSQ